MWGVGDGLCQTGFSQPNVTDLNLYESFLRQVHQFGNSSRAVLLAGQPTDPPEPRLEDAIPLTGDEIKLLNAVATETEARFRRLANARRPVTLEALFRTIESETDPAKEQWDAASWRNQQQSRIEDSRRRVLREAVEQVNKALGDSRFAMLDQHVRAKTLDSYISSLRAAYPRPAKKKK